jgi:hypothetical protein
MYGYQPPQEEPDGSWREILAITRVAFEVLAKPLGLIMAALGLFVLFLWAAFTHIALTLIPLGIFAFGVWYLVRKEKRAVAAMEAEIEAAGHRRI